MRLLTLPRRDCPRAWRACPPRGFACSLLAPFPLRRGWGTAGSTSKGTAQSGQRDGCINQNWFYYFFIYSMLKPSSSELERNGRKCVCLCWYLPAGAFRRVKEQRLFPPASTAASSMSLMQSWISDVSRGQNTTPPTSLQRRALFLLSLSYTHVPTR